MKTTINKCFYLTVVIAASITNNSMCINPEITPPRQNKRETPGAPVKKRRLRRRRPVSPTARPVNRSLATEIDHEAIVEGRRRESENYRQALRSETKPEA